jgi:DNA-binding response OmpR family regulator
MELKERTKFIEKSEVSNMAMIDDTVALTGKAASLFELLLDNEDKTVTFEDISEKIWLAELTPHLNRSIDVHLCHIRKVIKDHGYKVHRYRQEGLKLYKVED